MKRLLGILLVVSLLTGCAAPVAKPTATTAVVAPAPTAVPTPTPTPMPTPTPAMNGDFRGVNWGMSRQDVIKCEGREPSYCRSDRDYFDDVEVMGFPATVVYEYKDNSTGGSVIEGFYYFTQSHTNDNDYIDDYQILKEALTQKYGQPFQDTELWKDDVYKDYPDKYGMAVSEGRLDYLSEWKTSTTKISMLLSGDNNKIDVFIRYMDLSAPETTPDASGL